MFEKLLRHVKHPWELVMILQAKDEYYYHYVLNSGFQYLYYQF